MFSQRIKGSGRESGVPMEGHLKRINKKNEYQTWVLETLYLLIKMNIRPGS